MINGTSVMTGVAAHCVHDARTLAAIALTTHALYIQALRGTNQSFHPFIHRHKPHRGQVLAARLMLELLDGSGMIRDELDGRHEDRGDAPIQDRYSLRCLPQYIGPILDGLDLVGAPDRSRDELRQRQSADRRRRGAQLPRRQLPRPVHRRGDGPAPLLPRPAGQAPRRADRAADGAGVQSGPAAVAGRQPGAQGQHGPQGAADLRQLDHAGGRLPRRARWPIASRPTPSSSTRTSTAWASARRSWRARASTLRASTWASR